MKSQVYFGSINHGQAATYASLAEKHDRIIDLLDLSSITKGDKVAIKMHLGFREGYQIVPVFFVRRLVKKIKETGAFPFITDNPTAVYNAVDRGYTQETCGCPLIPISGIKDGYYDPVDINYRTVDSMNMAGVLHDADVLFNVIHVKGHQTCGYGGAFKNLALGGYSGEDRWNKIHGIENSIKWYDDDKVDPDYAQYLIESCPCNALEYDIEKNQFSNKWWECMNGNCLECSSFDHKDALNIGPQNFSVFPELMSIATQKILDTFDKEKLFHLGYLLDITPQCDCLGIIQPNVVPDLGIVGSRDIVAVEESSLDLINDAGLIKTMIPPYIKKVNLNPDHDLHPFQRLWGNWKDPYLVCEFGEKLGLGNRKYNLNEILPPKETLKMETPKRVFERQPTFY